MYPGFDNQNRARIRQHVDMVIYCLRRGFGPEAFHADAGTQKNQYNNKLWKRRYHRRSSDSEYHNV